MNAGFMDFSLFISQSDSTFQIPVYQRNYDWKEEQCKTLFEDIERISQKDTKHFLGTLVYLEDKLEADFHTYTIIDGQQRLTTIMLFLKALADSESKLRDKIYDTYLENRYNDNNEKLRIKLKAVKSDFQDFNRLIDSREDGNNINNENSRVIKNYKFFRRHIEDSKLSADILFKGFLKLSIVSIKLDKGENPQFIFESLNSTGLDLTAADLIRNFILMGQNYKEQERLYNAYWTGLEDMLGNDGISDFVRDYLTMKTGEIPNKNYVYNSFKKYVNGEGLQSEPLLKELLKCGEYYSWFKRCSCDDDEINKRLEHFQTLKCTVIYPLLLFIFNKRFCEKEFEKEILLETLDILVSYIVRRLLCELPTNALNKVFPRIIKDVDFLPGQTFTERLVNSLASKKSEARFPKDQELKEHISAMDFYQKKSFNKFILEEIEKTKSKETVDFEDLSIEHIMPQTLSDEWKKDLGDNYEEVHNKYRNTLGNLTLTGYNSELSNKTFLEKKETYKESNVCLTKKLADLESFGKKEIEERCSSMIADISNIWKCPQKIQDAKHDYDLDTDFLFTSEMNFTGTKPTILEISGEEYKVSSWRELMQKLFEVLYEKNEQQFRYIAELPKFNKVFNADSSKLRQPVSSKVIKDIYMEGNLSTTAIINICKHIIESFDEELLDDIIFRLA